MITFETEQLEALFNNSPSPYWIVDDDLTVIFANDAARELYNANCMADGVRMFLSAEESKCAISELCDGKGYFTFSTISGNIAVSITPYSTLDGKKGGFVQLTPRKTHTESVTATPRSINNVVSDLAIPSMLHSLVGETVYTLVSLVKRVKGSNVNFLGEEIENEVDRATLQCYRLLRIADNLASDIDAYSGICPSTTVLNYWDGCAALLDDINIVLCSANKHFEYDLPQSNIFVRCNIDRLAISLFNLVSNCYVHCGPDTSVIVTGHEIGNRAVLTIRDNGHGFSEKAKEQMFQPFAAVKTPECETLGLGLGLHLARGLIASMGGTITVDSDGSGTTVTISIEMVDEQPEPIVMFGCANLYPSQDRYSPLYTILCDVVKPPLIR